MKFDMDTAQPKRMQRKRTKGFKLPANCFYVGRPSFWGNPFRVTNGDCDHPDCGPKSHPPITAQMAVEAYRRYLPGLENAQPNWAKLIGRLRGKDLACWCKLCERHKDGKPLNEVCNDCAPCHVDPLGELANAD